jgi:hypothetical protein
LICADTPASLLSRMDRTAAKGSPQHRVNLCAAALLTKSCGSTTPVVRAGRSGRASADRPAPSSRAELNPARRADRLRSLDYKPAWVGTHIVSWFGPLPAELIAMADELFDAHLAVLNAKKNGNRSSVLGKSFDELVTRTTKRNRSYPARRTVTEIRMPFSGRHRRRLQPAALGGASCAAGQAASILLENSLLKDAGGSRTHFITALQAAAVSSGSSIKASSPGIEPGTDAQRWSLDLRKVACSVASRTEQQRQFD